MAPHRRTRIRQLIVDRLIAANTKAATRVYPGRLQPVTEDELWAGGVIMVYTGEERTPLESYPRSHNQGPLQRSLTLDLEAFAPAFSDDDPNDPDFIRDAFLAIDVLTAQVEGALETFDLPGFGSSILRLVKVTPEIGRADDGGMPVAKALMTYDLGYMTPYRECSDPLVDNESLDLTLRGLYPGGQVIEGCPAGNIGEACPMPDATVVPIGEHLPPPDLGPVP